ncbi:riboflavin biosynthesis protein RibF [Deinococcus maricopensis]|uniref:Riboflavin biosynthesis protein n=1 Tax=Deinococcus maricopensis (strain DSM 21211 / LMG 22137 / NRRL B-23946 / LB-34) TaxID=709986 RepID=E8U8A1_DEIML|nr:riboflavin biosynthesis protein RibF [Deinococcus maricopensis]ADV67290.1 riboflavin biosynthesis protein RibF [Deinococcus maricopensis DSM 21211]
MKTYVSPTQRPDTETVVAVGSFDGVHLGHQALLARLKERARHYRVPSVVYTFDPPTRVLMQGVEFLSTLPEKLDLLARFGVDEVIAVPFTREFAARPKDAFLDDLRTLRPRALVVGEDFHFGRGRAGGVADLREVTADVVPLPMHGLNGEDIKSTRIRAHLQQGDVTSANRFLGRHYDAAGVVVRGDQLGRTIGFPTANIRVPEGKALPLGVFAVSVTTDHGRYGGMANIGMRPTVNGTERRFEVNVLDFEGDLYGQEIVVKFYQHLRAEQRFSGLDALKAQLHEDQAQARAALRGVL